MIILRVFLSLMDIRTYSSFFATDRISNLPCDVLDNILKYLPVHDAVKTSILSRGWRYRWVTIPHLVFDENFLQILRGTYTMESIVYQILLLHKGPIVKFILELPYDLGPAVDHWFHFLSNHCIEELKLKFPYIEIHRAMPHHLFTFDQLKHLHLVNAVLESPSTFEGFSRLVKLDLVNVRIDSGKLTSFISKCPMLKYLNIYRNYHSICGNIEIEAPNLESFCFEGILRSICFVKAPLLEEITITLSKKSSVRVFRELESNLIEFFGRLSFIKRLRLNGGFLQFLARSEVPQNLPNNLCQLVVLDLFGVDFSIIGEVTCALCLIRSSPTLQILQIRSTTIRDVDVEDVVQYLKAQQKWKHRHLKKVNILQFSGSEAELEFVKLLLSSATALRKLEFYPSLADEYEGFFMLKKLARFRRASSKAELIFHL
ncbi:hypothetical protein CDL12_29357 [Handroanthus impetiginosus]|uniref:F-box domain-containing protein n=1 Tax=Handroanthus impetiginosus TaxID=429701 RepID=A0A2G9FYL7_9LAMI|nr:hypothetical protein CDL12_29357 [Handroanthus impetiginosus]